MTTHGGTPRDAAWHGETRVFPSAGEFEHAAVQAVTKGALVLCATARLARRLLHRCRQTRLADNTNGWETPRMRSFRGWVYETYNALWQPRRPLSPALSLLLWHKALKGLPVPDGLIIQPTLYSQLQASLDALLEAGLDPVGNAGEHRLAGFRRKVAVRFLAHAEHEGAVLWRDMVSAVGVAVADGRVAIPQNTILAGFDDISPLAQPLCDALAARSRTVLWHSEAEPLPATRVRLYATPEQECRAVCADVLRVWNGGDRNLAVVFADRTCFPMLKRCFDDLAGLERPDFERTIRYNLTIGTPLVKHPLFQTAIIPLRLPGEILPIPLLTSLLVSPYIREPETHPADSLRAALWEPEQVMPLSEALKALADRGYSMAPFQQLARRQKAPLAAWLDGMQECLAALGFCRFEGQHRSADVLARQHLDDIFRTLAREAGTIVMDSSSALAWLSTAAENIIISEKTPETAGIQVLNPTEARGLAFEHLWLVGAHDTTLLPPAQEWPFLDPDEQRLLEGGMIERQWSLGKRHLAALMAAAPHIHVSRAMQGDEETPYTPCPFLHDEVSADGNPVQETCNPWANPTAEWMRARWLREGYLAFTGGSVEQPRNAESAVTPLSGEWSVTAIEDLAGCPFQFFCSRILKLKPLALPDAGIDPRMRGKVLHGILKIFADGLSDHAIGWPEDGRDAKAWLEQVVDHELSRCPDNIFWQVERSRLLGDAAMPGILPVWLDQERERARAGWRFALTEAPFAGLTVAGLILRGRIDRIDRHTPRAAARTSTPQSGALRPHESEGFAVWDYKSGPPPSVASVIGKVTELQLPAYLLALQRGLIPDLKDIASAPVQAGYICLEKAEDSEVAPLSYRHNPVNWSEVLPQWETALAQRVASPRQGHFEADPRPGSPAIFHSRAGACQFCEFFNLCGFFDRQAASADAESDLNHNEETEP
ncbi:MAG: PD-(D/E)XK nuclease family protein [Kiritimatiellae bacterium]|nr:PD-(D/E)XK nuclease family protein [Kiritimatiellia bacterium]